MNYYFSEDRVRGGWFLVARLYDNELAFALSDLESRGFEINKIE